MKIIHTSDWHLGKKLFKVSRLKEQEQFLNWLVDQIKQLDANVLIVAGDIYDCPNPPADAIRLFYNFLHRMSSETKCSALIIAGNHDSGAFLEAPKSILQDKRIEIVGKLSSEVLPTKIIDDVQFFFLPFFRSYEILQIAKSLKIKDELEDSKIVLKTIEMMIENAKSRNSKTNILIAHHIFGNLEKIEMGGSEQVISLSGLDSIPNSLLEKHFDYVALGHIHKKLTIKNASPITRYCGAPLSFRFSEKYNKSITLLNLGSTITTDEIEIPTFRKLISINCSYENLDTEIKSLKKELHNNTDNLPPLLEVQLLTKDPQVGIADNIREELKDYNIELLSFRTIIEGRIKEDEQQIILQGPPQMDELFKMFYFSKHPESENVPAEITRTFNELLDEVIHEKELSE